MNFLSKSVVQNSMAIHKIQQKCDDLVDLEKMMVENATSNVENLEYRECPSEKNTKRWACSTGSCSSS